MRLIETEGVAIMYRYSTLIALSFLVACADRAPMPTQPTPAGKTTEAWGFDFRIRIQDGLAEQVPIGN